MNTYRLLRRTAWLCCVAGAWSQIAPAANSTDGARLTAFVSADGVTVDGVPGMAARDSVLLNADLLGSWEVGQFRSLAEFVASTEEVELERLQIGWELSPNTIIWAGRFHQPASYWGYSYHHGQFAQTAITRPQVDQWEDSGGLVPQHLEGLLMDASITTGGRRIDVSLGAGIAPRLADGSLDPYKVFGDNQSSQSRAYAARLTWFPDALRDPSVGLLAMQSRIVSSRTVTGVPRATGFVAQRLLGGFVDYPSDRWHLTAVGYHVQNDAPQGTGSPQETFWSGYVQGERDVSGSAALYGRAEFNSDPDAAVYAGRMDPIARFRLVAGLRWGLGRKQAISLELNHSRYTGASGTEIRAQWSAVVP
jgi:hypothetical protein